MIRESLLRISNATLRVSARKQTGRLSRFARNPTPETTSLMTEFGEPESEDEVQDEPVPQPASEKIFSDTRATKDTCSKYQSVRLFLAVLLSANIFLGLTLYEYIALDPASTSRVSKLLSGANTVLTVASIAAWTASKYFDAALKRERLQLSASVTYLQDYGRARMAGVFLLFLLHPFAPLIDVPFFWQESYWEADYTFTRYDRPTVEHLIMAQFVFCTLLLLKVLLELIKFANNRAHRIAGFFDMRLDTTYMLRAVMVAHPIAVVLFIQVLGIVVCGVLLRIAESNYLKHIPPGLGAEERAAELSFRGQFFIYLNAFWYVIASMTTVGYGDLYSRSTLGRFVAMLASVYGLMTTSLIVVAFTNLMTMGADEDNAHNIVLAIRAAREKDRAATELTGNILRAGYAFFRGDLQAQSGFREEFWSGVKEYVAQHNAHRRMGMDEYSYINTKASRIATGLRLWDLAQSTEEARLREDMSRFVFAE